MILRFSYFSIALLSLQAQVGAAAETPARPAVETLDDGNVRDFKPDPQRVAALVSKTKANMIELPGGTFDMGDWGAEVNSGGLPFDPSPDSKPLHKVSLTGFSMGKYPVTYAEFDVFTASIGLPRINQQTLYRIYRKPGNPAGVSWQGAKDYCQWLGKQAGLPVDLPSEAQWEYAARSAGKRYLYPTDDGLLDDGRNVPTLAQQDAAGGMVAAGSFPPNAAGFHDFGAGIREWTNDWYAADYYAKSPRENPTGPSDGTGRVVRGNFGSMQMTFQRWHRPPAEKTGTWTLYSAERGGPKRQIPYTKYSAGNDSAFRCVINQSR